MWQTQVLLFGNFWNLKNIYFQFRFGWICGCGTCRCRGPPHWGQAFLEEFWRAAEGWSQATSPVGNVFPAPARSSEEIQGGWQKNFQAASLHGELITCLMPLGAQWFPKHFTSSPAGLPKRAGERSPGQGVRGRRVRAAFVWFRNFEDPALPPCKWQESVLSSPSKWGHFIVLGIRFANIWSMSPEKLTA